MYEKIELASHLKGQLYLGDNLEVMKSLPSSSIDLVYIDPPFFSGRNYIAESKIDKGEKRKFEDIFNGDLNSYLKFLHLRLVEMKRLLKITGSIYVHLDWHAVFEVKVFIMDRLFGRDNFKNDIIWSYKTGGATTKHFSRKHDIILFYTKTGNYTFNSIKERIYYDKPFFNPDIDEQGRYYADVLPVDIWEIPAVINVSKERIDYPTQKPEALLEKIINASSNPGDTVADLFAGSGTTLAVAQRLDRKWVGCDKNNDAINLIKARLYGNKSIYDTGYQTDISSIW